MDDEVDELGDEDEGGEHQLVQLVQAAPVLGGCHLAVVDGHRHAGKGDLCTKLRSVKRQQVRQQGPNPGLQNTAGTAAAGCAAMRQMWTQVMTWHLCVAVGKHALVLAGRHGSSSAG